MLRAQYSIDMRRRSSYTPSPKSKGPAENRRKTLLKHTSGGFSSCAGASCQ